MKFQVKAVKVLDIKWNSNKDDMEEICIKIKPLSPADSLDMMFEKGKASKDGEEFSFDMLNILIKGVVSWTGIFDESESDLPFNDENVKEVLGTIMTNIPEFFGEIVEAISGITAKK